MTAKIYSKDLSAELINRVECRIEIDSEILSAVSEIMRKENASSSRSENNNRTKSSTLSIDKGESQQKSSTIHLIAAAKGDQYEKKVDNQDENEVMVTNPTLLIDDQLLKASTTTISTLVALLVLTVLTVVGCCSGFVWFKCRVKRQERDEGSGGGGRGLRGGGNRCVSSSGSSGTGVMIRGPLFGSSSASSMSTGSPHSPLSELAGKRDSLEKKPPPSRLSAHNNNNPSKDFKRVFSIRLPFDLLLDHKGFSRHHRHHHHHHKHHYHHGAESSNKFNVSSSKFIFFFVLL